MRVAIWKTAFGALALAAIACTQTRNTGNTAWDAVRPVDFDYEMAGERHALAELRGRPLLLVLIRTSEIASQAYMRELVAAFGQIAGELRFLVLTIEPQEAPFVEMYAEFEKLPFPVGVADASVGPGKSTLGAVSGIPASYFLDSKGQVLHNMVGVTPSADLVAAQGRLFD